MIKIFCISVISLLIASNACAFQFEENRWGSDIESVYNALKAKKNDIERGEYYVKYQDIIFEKNCYVKFYFTGKTRVLAQILIEWRDNNVGARIKKKIIEKYGSPNSGDDLLKQFVWEEGRDEVDERMVFNCVSKVSATLNYYGGAYWVKFKEEREELFDFIPFL